jgi:hypothetical protein
MSDPSPEFVLQDWDAASQRFMQREAPVPTSPVCFIFDTCPLYQSEETE